MTFNVFPDAEAIASYAIRTANIIGLESRVYSSIPASPTYALAVVQRLGGTPAVRQYLDRARLQIDVWGGAKGDRPGGPTKSDVHDIAQEARVVLFELEGEIVHDPVDAFVAGVEDALGMTWLPDVDTARDRYVFSVYLYLRAELPVGSGS